VSGKLLAIFLLALCLAAQWTPSHEDISFSGEIRGSHPGDVDRLVIDLRPASGTGAGDRTTTDYQGHFSFNSLAPGNYQLRVLPAPGGEPIFEQQVQVNSFTGSVTLELPERAQAKPISGIVSVQQLRLPPSKKAVRAFVDAQKFSQAHDSSRAIEKLQLAVQLAPEFREAHINLGAQYARIGRYQEAMTHLQTALDIGPPDPKAYTNLGFCYFKLGQLSQAEALAKKALALDPVNAPAQTLLRVLTEHSN
jgi:tetratricopeptide (TPR) repeat protein